MLMDGIVFYDNQDKVIFNQYSFCELIKYLLVEFVGISYEDASNQVDHSSLAEPISDVMEIYLLNHELPYYWAMCLYYGNCYWQKGILSQPEDLEAYAALENQIIKEHLLNDPFM